MMIVISYFLLKKCIEMHKEDLVFDTEVDIMTKVSLVTGGTSGLGLQLVRDLMMEGYKVYSLSRNKNATELPEVSYLYGDVSDIKTLEDAYDIIDKNEGKLDVLINNAGIIYPGGVEKLGIDEWNKMFAVNVNGSFYEVKTLLPLLKTSENANVINVSSISSQMTGSSIAYSACKAALDMMTKSMAKELASYKIRVNSINPGIVNTGFQIHNELMTEKEYQEFLKEIIKTYPFGIGEAKDISNLICFLISEDAKWITGSNYIIDGGRSINI